MKTKMLAISVLSVLLVSSLLGIAEATVAPSSYVYSYLTPSPAMSYLPRFSPNGKWIAYEIEDEKIAVQRIDDTSMSTQTIIFAAASGYYSWCPVWTPNGKSIYFIYEYEESSGNWHGFIYGVDIKIVGNNVFFGTPYVVLDGGDKYVFNVDNFDISPDGTSLVFWRVEGVWSDSSWDPSSHAHLYLVPRRPNGTFNIGDRMQLTNSTGVSDYEPRFSPNGKEIAFWSGEGPLHSEGWVEVISIDSHGYPIADSRRVVMKNDALWPFWSPDGKMLGVKAYTASRSRSDIWILDSQTGVKLWEVTNSAVTNGGYATTGDWSPTEWNSIVFKIYGSTPNIDGIHYARAIH